MASPIIVPLVCKLKQTTNTLGRATNILRSAFPAEHVGDKAVSVQLPRRDAPTYILPNQQVQPWELLPMKAAALKQYPNFFNNSCMFFGSINRDVVNGVPFSLLRITRLALDTAKVVRNLGIIDGFEVVQRREHLGPHDFVWTSDQPEPNDIYDVSLFRQRLLRLQLRSDMFSFLPPSARAAALPPAPPSTQLAPASGLLPFSAKNISKASRPVLMYPRQLEAARQLLPSGLFVCYHHELGITTDAVAELHDVPVLVAAHVGLPLSQVVQIRGAMRVKAQGEKGLPLKDTVPLKSWNMVEQLRKQVAERHAALLAAPGKAAQERLLQLQLQRNQQQATDGKSGVATAEGAAAAGDAAELGPSLLQEQMEELQAHSRQFREKASRQLSEALSDAQELDDGLLAWRVLRSGALINNAPSSNSNNGKNE